MNHVTVTTSSIFVVFVIRQRLAFESQVAILGLATGLRLAYIDLRLDARDMRLTAGALKMREWKMQEWKIQELKHMESRPYRNF